jgi:hypothetical protein
MWIQLAVEFNDAACTHQDNNAQMCTIERSSKQFTLQNYIKSSYDRRSYSKKRTLKVP